MVIACLVVLGTTAGCALGEDDQTSTEAPQCASTPRSFVRQAWAFSGEVQDVAVRCETIYVAGGGSIGRRTGPLALVSAASGARRGLAAELTGAVDDTSLAEAPVEAVVDDGHGGWYVGGSFAFVDETHCPGLTHVTGRGQVDQKFCPKVDGPVHELVRIGNTLYVAGDFSHVAGRPRKTLAAVSTSGLLLPWAPRLEPKLTCPDRDEPGVLTASVSALGATSSAVYVGGFFSGASGVARPALVALDPRTGVPTRFDAALERGLGADDCGGPIVTALLATSRRLVVGGPAFLRVMDPTTGAEIGPRLPNLNVSTLAARASRLYAGGVFGAAAFDLGSGARLQWRPRIRGRVCCFAQDRSVEIIVPMANKVYLGGNFATAGGAARKFAAAVDADAGDALAWDPHPNGPVLGLGTGGHQVLIAGALTSVNVVRRNGLVAIDGPAGRLMEWAPRAVGTNALALVGDRLIIGGNFKRVEGEPRGGLASFHLETGELDGWSPAVGRNNYGVTALAASGERVYAGGDFIGAASALDAESLPRNGAAAFDAESGEVLDWDPTLDEETGDVHVHAIATTADGVYLGGEFDTAAGIDHRGAVAVDRDGTPSSEWVPDPDDLGFVYALASGPHSVYLGGWFATAGGARRSGVAEVSAVAGRATDFDAGVVGEVEALWLEKDRLFLAGDFATIQSRPRAGFAALDAASGRLLPLDQSPSDRARFGPGTVVVAGGAAIVDGFIQGNGEQLVVMPLAR